MAGVLLFALANLTLGFVGHTHLGGGGGQRALLAAGAGSLPQDDGLAADDCPVCSALSACAALVVAAILGFALDLAVKALHAPDAQPPRSGLLWASAASRAPPLSSL